MPEPIRQLAAIMFTDIVGYTSLMDKDEALAFALLEKNRSIQKPLIKRPKRLFPSPKKQVLYHKVVGGSSCSCSEGF